MGIQTAHEGKNLWHEISKWGKYAWSVPVQSPSPSLGLFYLCSGHGIVPLDLGQVFALCAHSMKPAHATSV